MTDKRAGSINAQTPSVAGCINCKQAHYRKRGWVKLIDIDEAIEHLTTFSKIRLLQTDLHRAMDDIERLEDENRRLKRRIRAYERMSHV